MALERNPTHLGDIGDGEPEADPDADRIYEQQTEKKADVSE